MKTKAKSPTKGKTKAVPPEIKTTRTRTIPAGEFKAKCLAIIDEVHDRRERVIITKYGKPMASLEPMKKDPGNLFGAMRRLATITGDLVEPIVDPKDWDADIFPPAYSGHKK